MPYLVSDLEGRFSHDTANKSKAHLFSGLKGIKFSHFYNNLHLFQTATLYPGLMFGACFFLNFFIWGKHSSGAVSIFLQFPKYHI